MQLKTVEEVANQIWNAGSKLTHNDLDEILTQDRADIRAVLREVIGTKIVEVPEATRDWFGHTRHIEAAQNNKTVEDILTLIDNTLGEKLPTLNK